MLKNVVSVCVVTHNNQDEILNLLASIYENTHGLKFNVFVVDNASDDATVSVVKKNYPPVKIIELKENKGFGFAHNQVINELNSEYHVIINPDIYFSKNVIKILVDYLNENDDAVLITPKILCEDGSEQYLAKKDPKLKYLLAGRFEKYFKFLSKYRDEYTMKRVESYEPIEIEFCTGCFMLIRTEILKAIKGFDENFFMYFEDADLSRRARKYGKDIFYPKASVVHLWERISAKKLKFLFIHISSMIKYFYKWKFKKKNLEEF